MLQIDCACESCELKLTAGVSSEFSHIAVDASTFNHISVPTAQSALLTNAHPVFEEHSVGSILLLLGVVAISLCKNVRATINSTGSVLVRCNRLSVAIDWGNRGTGACCDVTLELLVISPGSSPSQWSGLPQAHQ